jgi:excisionase family DNA binding protein
MVGSLKMASKMIGVRWSVIIVREPGNPFAQRLTCTIAEACEVTGLGRTKLYQLISDGHVVTTTIGRRRLVLVQSLLAVVGASNL